MFRHVYTYLVGQVRFCCQPRHPIPLDVSEQSSNLYHVSPGAYCADFGGRGDPSPPTNTNRAGKHRATELARSDSHTGFRAGKSRKLAGQPRKMGPDSCTVAEGVLS